MSVSRILNRLVWLTTLLLAGVPMPAEGQADSGSRVRVTIRKPSQRVVGTLVSVEADSLRLKSPENEDLVVPTGSVVRMERSVGRHSRTGHGAAVGGVALGATGLLLGLLASSAEGSFYEIGPGEVVGVTAFFAAVGAGVGALIGSASHAERWEPVPLSSPFSPQAARPRGTILGLALRF